MGRIYWVWCDKCFPARFSDLITSQCSSTSFCRLLFADNKNVLLYLSCSAHALLKRGLRVLNHAKVLGEKFLGWTKRLLKTVMLTWSFMFKFLDFVVFAREPANNGTNFSCLLRFLRPCPDVYLAAQNSRITAETRRLTQTFKLGSAKRLISTNSAVLHDSIMAVIQTSCFRRAELNKL